MTAFGSQHRMRRSSFPMALDIAWLERGAVRAAGWRSLLGSLTKATSSASKINMGGNSKTEKSATPNKEDTRLPSELESVTELPLEDSLDLHMFAPKEIKSLVDEYLYQCQAAGFREVRLIHGRGTGTQRAIVRSLLARSPYVTGFGEAAREYGGWGASMV